uniref:Uncharacterized protein n=1 Tax=Pithovirus LCPAC201 TaxID=2506591 RepID=A0A481Z4S6_9VIRU|nr:MAG: hypothetical protein LCPAC201_01940 [Pithovirus LCPAC201]
MFSGGSLKRPEISSPITSGTCISRNSLAVGKNPGEGIEIDNSLKLEPITPIKGILNNLKEYLDKEDGPDIIYSDMDSVMFSVPSVEEMEKLNKSLETYNSLKLVSEKSFQMSTLNRKVDQS